MTSSKLDWALHYAGMGLYVFPLHPNTKRPIEKDWPDLATTDPAQIVEWWEKWPDANIGAHPGASGHAVIDVDNKKEDGHASLERLETELGLVPITMTTFTPTNGLHIWLSLPGSCKNSAGALAPGIDTRGRRGFVVMGGSTIDGVAYHTDETPILEAPEGWKEAFSRLGERDENRESQGDLDVEGNVSSAKQHLDALIAQGDVAIEGQGGNDRTFRLFTMLRDMGVSEDLAIEIAQPWNSACVPPWQDDEFETIARNAYTYAQNEPGAKALADPSGTGFASIQSPSGFSSLSPEATDRPSRFTPLTIKEMADLPEPEWLIPDVIPHYELSMLFGPYGSFKSFAALDMALSIAAGIPCLGMKHEQRSFPVLYIAGEGQIGIGKQRIPAWKEHNSVDGEIPFRMIPNAPLVRGGDAELRELFKAIDENCEGALPRLVVIDTHARSMSGLDENTVQDTAKTIEFYEQIAHRYSCAVLVVHHSGLDPDRERGSTALGAAFFTVMQMEHDESQDLVALRCRKMKDAEPFKEKYFEPEKVGDSVVLVPKKWEVKQATPHYSELYLDAVAALTALGAFSYGLAQTTTVVASQMPQVLAEDDPELREKAKRNMAKVLETNAKKELRALVYGDEKPLQWFLPTPD